MVGRIIVMMLARLAVAQFDLALATGDSVDFPKLDPWRTLPCQPGRVTKEPPRRWKTEAGLVVPPRDGDVGPTRRLSRSARRDL